MNNVKIYYSLNAFLKKPCSLQPAAVMAILKPIKTYYWDKEYAGEVPQTVTQGPK